MNFWTVIYRFAFAMLVVLLGVGIVLMFMPRAKEIREFHRKRVSLTQQNEHLQAQVDALIEKQARFLHDPAFVERTAREAGMVKSNEVRYMLEDAPATR